MTNDGTVLVRAQILHSAFCIQCHIAGLQRAWSWHGRPTQPSLQLSQHVNGTTYMCIVFIGCMVQVVKVFASLDNP